MEHFILLLKHLGFTGIGIWAGLESMGLPVPVDAYVWYLIFIKPGIWVAVWIILSVGSWIGAMIAYFTGFYFGKPVLKKLSGKNKMLRKIEVISQKQFRKHGILTLLLSGFLPIGYKIFTYSAGVTKMKFRNYLWASFAGRAFKFMIISYLGYLVATNDHARVFIEKYITDIVILLAVILGTGYTGYVIIRKKMKKKAV
jgi:membrane protein DedA with SNARE-associated domain